MLDGPPEMYCPEEKIEFQATPVYTKKGKKRGFGDVNKENGKGLGYLVQRPFYAQLIDF